MKIRFSWFISERCSEYLVTRIIEFVNLCSAVVSLIWKCFIFHHCDQRSGIIVDEKFSLRNIDIRI